jgi:hypothetical protein
MTGKQTAMIAGIQRVTRRAARITSPLMLGLVIAFATGEGIPNVFKQPPRVQVEFAAVGLIIVGLVVGWRWEAIGGATTIAGVALFTATELLVNRRLPGPALWLFAVPGLLLLASSGLGIGRRQPRVDNP